MPLEGSSSSDRAESSSTNQPRLDKSKTERQQKVTHILAEDAAKIFDDKISAGKKVLYFYFWFVFFSILSLFYF